MKNKFLSLLVCLTISTLFGCNKNNNNNNLTEDIHILYTTDVHCGIDDNIGYASFAGFKNQLKKENKYVTTIDAGDALQGAFVGAISKGEYIIDIMNEVGYDIFTLGNHEFDYGMDVLSDLINKFDGDVLSCNFNYIGNNENKFDNVSKNNDEK